MDEKQLEKFDPTVAELTAMVEATKGITATDLKDKAQLAIVRENRIALKKARVSITKIGKDLRADAVAFQNAVIAKEKELIGIIEPEEDRLADIEEQARLQAIREERLEKLPARKARLAELEVDGRVMIVISDEEILAMDSEQFEAHYNSVVAERNEIIRLKQIEDQERLEKERKEEQARIDEAKKAEDERIKAEQKEAQDKIDAERKALEEEKAEIARQKELKEAEDKARADEKARIEQEAKDKAEADKIEADRIAKEKAEEAKKLEKRKAFMAFRASHGWTEETKADFKVEETAEGYVLYKKLGVFAK